MLMSLFTPTHDLRFLKRLAASISRQTCQNFEWIIVTNGAVAPADVQVPVTQARVISYPEATGKIGALKQFACAGTWRYSGRSRS